MRFLPIRKTSGSLNSRGFQSGAFERLEQRVFMAADLAASVTNGILTITGGVDQDSVSIVGTAVPGEFVVTGKANFDSSNTLINGQTEQTFSGVTEKISVSLGNGDNQVTIEETKHVDLEIITGTGNDSITIGKYVAIPVQNSNEPIIVVDNSLVVKSGAGNDTIFVGRVFGQAEIRIDGEAGDDKISTYNTSSEDLFCGGDVVEGESYIDDGNDQISIGYATTAEFLIGKGDRGNDLVSVYCCHAGGDAYITGGSGDDTVAIDVSVIDGDCTVGGDHDYYGEPDGNDTVLVARSIIHYLRASVGDGNNSFILGKYYAYDEHNRVVLRNGGCSVDQFILETTVDGRATNVGSNHSEIVASIFGQVNIYLGNGDDELIFVVNQVEGSTLIDGKEGVNRLLLIGNAITNPQINNFTLDPDTSDYLKQD